MKHILLALALAVLPWSGLQAAEDLGDLDWQIGSATHRLNGMSATYTTGYDEAFLQGRDTVAFNLITQGHDLNAPQAVVYRTEGPLADSWIEFIFEETGYLATDDWDEYIDSDAILESIRQGTEEANRVRGEGYPELTIDGWVEKPFLDRDKGIVYWAIALHNSDGFKSVNASALKLGRKGYVEILWVGGAEQFASAQATLRPSLQSFNYSDGFRYADFQPGIDTVAAVGVGALAYQMMTGNKANKGILAGAIAVIAVFLKKAWFVLFFPLIFLWRKFTRKDEE